MKSKTFKIAFYSVFFILLGFISSCSSDDDYILEPEHQHEEVTRVILQFTEINDPSKVAEYSYEVPEGSTEFPITAINLPPGTYQVETHFYASSSNHYYEVTSEIFQDDADDHFVFYQILGKNGLTISYADNDYVDTLGNKLGFKTIWTIPEGLTNQTVYLYLLHQPASKKQDAVSLQELGGEVDLEAHYLIN